MRSRLTDEERRARNAEAQRRRMARIDSGRHVWSVAHGNTKQLDPVLVAQIDEILRRELMLCRKGIYFGDFNRGDVRLWTGED